MPKPSTSRMRIQGHNAWLKHYSDQARRLRLWLLGVVVRWLDIAALRPPPRGDAGHMRQTELRRIRQLHSEQVRVPQVLGEGEGYLLLSDLGETLSEQLRRAQPEVAEQLLSAAVRAIARVHRRGAYLGQPLARNITVDSEGQIGFLDFEEDPGEVMTLSQAQTRDWLIFCAGAARHLPFDEQRMGELIAEGLREESDEVLLGLDYSVHRLRFLPPLTRWLGRRAAGLGKALIGLRQALVRHSGAACLLVLLSLDLLTDGELEAVRWLAAMIQLVDEVYLL